MTKLKQLKQNLKLLAVEIRKLKSQRKGAPSGYVAGLDDSRYRARHMHIAYCLLRGRKYEEVEKQCHQEPNMRLVDKYMEDYRESQDVCTSEEGSIETAADSAGSTCGSGVL